MIDILSLLFPRKCAVCGNPSGKQPLCEECRERFSALGRPDYNNAHHYFNVRSDSVFWLIEYSDPFAKRLIYSFKYSYNPLLASMFAKLICFAVSESPVFDRQNAVMTYVPRSPRNISKYGFDQAKLLAYKLSHILGIKLIRLYKHKSHTRDQKKLTKAERLKNAKASYMPVKCPDLSGKTLFIVDDIITTGSTLNSCIALTSKCRCEHIIAVCIAKR